MGSLVQAINIEIEKKSLLKHKFYQLWSEGRLSMDNLREYSKEYFQMVKNVPDFVNNISYFSEENSELLTLIKGNANEEAEHIEPWIIFASGVGVNRNELLDYKPGIKTYRALETFDELTNSSYEEGVAALYAFEMELPKISAVKIEGLNRFYGIINSESLNYFQIHMEADIRHASLWREILDSIPEESRERAFKAAVKSLEAQNSLLDSVCEKCLIAN